MLKTFEWLFLFITFNIFALTANDSLDNKRLANMAEELVKLRSEVEALYTKADFRKVEVQEKLKTTMSQKRELERKESAYKDSEKELKQKIETNEKEIKSKMKLREKYLDVSLKQVQKTNEFLLNSLPFKKEERKKELELIKTSLLNKDSNPEKALSQLWSLIEDEIRLTSDNGLYNQNIEIDGQKRLVKIARLGMVLLYFKTLDSHSVGYVKKEGSKWQFIQAKSLKEEKQIRYLFECLTKNLKSGFFELPNPYSN